MATVLNFSDLGCLNESAAGSMGAGMASFVRAGFPAVRGFAVTPLALSEFLKKPEIANALDMLRSSAEHPDDGWRALRSVFNRTRLGWSHEIDVLAAFGELGSAVSITATTRHGACSSPVYGTKGEDVLDGIKHSWLKWLKGNSFSFAEQDLPAVLVREVIESEVSVELRKKGSDIRARAVFGLPEGLTDSGVSADMYEFSREGKLERMENRSQNMQYVAKASGPSKVKVAPDLQNEEKMTGEMLSSLASIMDFMRENSGVQMCEVCFVSSRPVICLATLNSDAADTQDLPPRRKSINLLETAEPVPASLRPSPVVAAGMFLCVDDMSNTGALGDDYLEGVILTGDPMSADSWKTKAAEAAAEAKRRFRASTVIFEFRDMGHGKADRLAAAVKGVSGAGMQAGVLIPGMRSADELAKVVRTLKGAFEGIHPEPAIWVRVMYPSNLFFMESLTSQSDVLALDLDSLGKLMLGGGDDGKWLPFSIPALEKALEQPLASKTGKVAIMSGDLVSTPSLLEFLVRNGADILCVKPSEVQTVKHIVASVEKRMLMEQGRVE